MSRGASSKADGLHHGTRVPHKSPARQNATQAHFAAVADSPEAVQSMSCAVSVLVLLCMLLVLHLFQVRLGAAALHLAIAWTAVQL
jgi:hypothetical protein